MDAQAAAEPAARPLHRFSGEPFAGRRGVFAIFRRREPLRRQGAPDDDAEPPRDDGVRQQQQGQQMKRRHRSIEVPLTEKQVFIKSAGCSHTSDPSESQHPRMQYVPPPNMTTRPPPGMEAGGLGYGPADIEKKALDGSWTVDFFGPPPGGQLALQHKVHPYSKFPRETLHLPDVYKGHNPYLTQVMIELITEEDLVPLKVILPIRETYNETTVTWNEYNFNTGLIGPVPEEGVSRLVTQQVNERRESYTRAGLAFMIEHGFWKTEKGRLSYALQIQQIKNATIDGLYIGVLEALLVCKTLSNYYASLCATTVSSMRFNQAMKLEVESWAEIQKSAHGWDMLNARAHRQLKLNGAKPDAWVVDEGTKAYISLVRPENKYVIAGPEGRELYNSQLPSAANTRFFDQKTGCLVFETKSFESPDSVEPINPLVRPRTIGEYYHSLPLAAPDKNYSTEHRTIIVYDEDRDGWASISLYDALDNCARFKHAGEPPHFKNHDEGDDLDDGPQFPKDYKDKEEDMFWAKDRPVAYFGDMNENGLPEEAVRDWSKRVIQTLDDTVSEGLTVMRRLVRELETEGLEDENLQPLCKGYFKSISNDAPLDGNGLANLLSDKKIYKDDHGEEYTFKALFKLGPCVRPWGFGNVAGIRTLANPCFNDSEGWGMTINDIHKRAVVAIAAFDKLTQALEKACYDNVFLRAAAVPYYYAHKNVEHALFANIFHRTQLPIVRRCVRKSTFPNVVKYGWVNVTLNNHEFLDQSEEEMICSNEMQRDIFRKIMDIDFQLKEHLIDENQIKILNHTHPEVYDKMLQLYDSKFGELKADHDVETIRICQMLLNFRLLTMARKNEWNYLQLAKHVDEKYFKMSAKDIFQIKHGVIDTDGDRWTEVTNYEYNIMIPESTAAHGVPTCETTGMTSSAEIRKHLKKNGNDHAREFLREMNDSLMFSTEQAHKKPKITGPGLEVSYAVNPAMFDVAQMSGDSAQVLQPGGLRGLEVDPPPVLNQVGANKRVAALSNYSKEFVDRWDKAQREPDELERCVKLAFFGVPVNARSLKHFLKNDMVFPFNVLYVRPYMTYAMATGICLKAGAATGETLVGDSDWQLGDRAETKTHYGHYTIRYLSFVHREQNVYHAYNYKCNGYLGGNDMKWNESLFAILEPYRRMTYPNPIDITGCHYDVTTGRTLEEKHYQSCNFYKTLHRWNNRKVQDGRESAYLADSSTNNQNTVCFQGHQAVYSTHTGAHTCVIENTGHWGRNVYPGCGKVRAGLNLALESIAFKEAYGGATQASHVMLG